MIVSRGLGRPGSGIVMHGLGRRYVAPVAIDCKYCRRKGVPVFIAPDLVFAGASQTTITVVKYVK